MWSDEGKIKEGKTGWNGGMLDNVHFKPLRTFEKQVQNPKVEGWIAGRWLDDKHLPLWCRYFYKSFY